MYKVKRRFKMQFSYEFLANAMNFSDDKHLEILEVDVNRSRGVVSFILAGSALEEQACVGTLEGQEIPIVGISTHDIPKDDYDMRGVLVNFLPQFQKEDKNGTQEVQDSHA